LASEIRTFVVGTQVKGQYWEKRASILEKDARKKPVFHCYSVVKIDRDQLEKATKNAIDKYVSGFKAGSAKQKAAEALKDAASAFANADNVGAGE
jgi:hypothetical protein